MDIKLERVGVDRDVEGCLRIQRHSYKRRNNQTLDYLEAVLHKFDKMLKCVYIEVYIAN